MLINQALGAQDRDSLYIAEKNMEVFPTGTRTNSKNAFRYLAGLYSKKKREKKQRRIRMMYPDDSEYQVIMDICVSCDDILKLTQQINSILNKVPREKSDMDTVTQLEIGKLEAIFSIVKTVNEEGHKPCHKVPFYKAPLELRSFAQEELIFIFSDESDIKFTGAQLRLNAHKSVWLRGRGKDINKIIRVDIADSGKTRISYYLLENISKEQAESDIPQIPRVGPTTPPEKSLEELGEGKTDFALTDVWGDSSSSTYFKTNIGLTLDYRHFLPKKVTFVDIQGSQSASYGYRLNTDIEISSHKQRANLELLEEGGKKIAFVKLKMSGKLSVGIPYDFNIYGPLSIDGQLSTTNTGTKTVTSTIRKNKREFFKGQYNINKAGAERIKITRDFNLSKKDSLRIQYNKKTKSNFISSDNQNNNELWLTFKKHLN